MSKPQIFFFFIFYGIVICKFMACGRKMIHNSMFDKMKQERKKEISIVSSKVINYIFQPLKIENNYLKMNERFCLSIINLNKFLFSFHSTSIYSITLFHS